MKYKKGFTLPMILIIILSIGVIVGAGYYFIKNKSFNLTNTAQASIAVVSPQVGEEWTVGTKHIIRWSSTNIPEKETIGIQLANPDLNEDGFWAEIIGGLKNSEEYTWEIPKTIKNGLYRLYIYTDGVERQTLKVVHDDVVIKISGSTAVSPEITKIFPTSGSLPSDVVSEIVDKNEVKEITLYGSGFNMKRIDDFSKNDIYISSGTAFALFRKESLDGHTLIIPLPLDLSAGKTTEDLVPGIYEIFVKTASGKSNSVYITLTKPVETLLFPKGKEILPSGTSIPTPKR